VHHQIRTITEKSIVTVKNKTYLLNQTLTTIEKN